MLPARHQVLLLVHPPSSFCLAWHPRRQTYCHPQILLFAHPAITLSGVSHCHTRRRTGIASYSRQDLILLPRQVLLFTHPSRSCHRFVCSLCSCSLSSFTRYRFVFAVLLLAIIIHSLSYHPLFYLLLLIARYHSCFIIILTWPYVSYEFSAS